MTAGSQATGSRSRAGAHRRPGGRGAGLTHTGIVEAAIALMDAGGASALTMRRLAQRLGVEPAALYWHVGSKDELCRAVVEEVGAQLRVASSAAGSPRARLEHHFTAIRDHWRRHPSVLELSRRYPPSAAGEVSRAGLELVVALGVAPDDVLDCYRALSWSVTGFVILEQNLADSAHHRRTGASEWTITIDDEPGATSTFDTDELFATMLGLALDGVEARAAPFRDTGR